MIRGVFVGNNHVAHLRPLATPWMLLPSLRELYGIKQDQANDRIRLEQGSRSIGSSSKLADPNWSIFYYSANSFSSGAAWCRQA